MNTDTIKSLVEKRNARLIKKNEETSTASVAGAGDDSSTVVVTKRPKVKKRTKDELEDYLKNP